MAKEEKRKVIDHFSVNVDASTDEGGQIILSFVDLDTSEETMIHITDRATSKWIKKALKQAHDLAWN